MREELPLEEFGRYSAKEAIRELKRVEIDAIEKARNYLEAKKYEDVVSILLDLDKEIDLLTYEARRLKLQGKLDVNIYGVLITGYADIKEKIFDLTDQHGILKEIRNLYGYHKHAIEVSKRT